MEYFLYKKNAGEEEAPGSRKVFMYFNGSPLRPFLYSRALKLTDGTAIGGRK
jgi:hypothetical protein